MNRTQLQAEIHALYNAEHAALGEAGALRQLEQARQWDLVPLLRAGGVLVFPHAGVADCGHQIAAAVHACLDSGADTVLVVSVLHAFSEEMEQARRRVAAGGAPRNEAQWGIQGPGLSRSEQWRGDHALMSWRFFWELETRRRGVAGPRVIERYPWLAGGKPEELPGIEELVEIARNAVIVSTADPFHHGIGYGDTPEDSLPPNEHGLALARQRIEEGIAILEKGDYWGYNQHCVSAKSDARDAGQVFRWLRGPMRGHILDMAYSDAATLYRSPPPTWVAAPLVGWELRVES
ncbi:MAG: hypothetical protein MUD01_00600 [Chloroflexaceae bacterium]|jgi:hypothetical protein|nr:hypothetical protein [Chloroflexaceae bacterium]